MKHLPRIASALYCEPWNILPATHAEICRQFREHLARGGPAPAGFEALQNFSADADDLVGPAWRDESGRIGGFHPQVTVIGSTAILPIRGMLGKHLSTLEMWCGASDYAIIAKQAANIAADDRITDVIFHIDSPGGNCVGNIECARALRSLSEKKKAIAYTDTQACSAAYCLASAAEMIIASPSAIVGSISTYCAYLDASRAYEMEGLEVKLFRSGDVKGAGYPGKPWTEAEDSAMQQVVEGFSAQFKGFVRENRKLPDAVMNGAFWPAQFAPGGLVDDSLDSLDDVLQLIARV
jgi:ClpP class serine protease